MPAPRIARVLARSILVRFASRPDCGAGGKWRPDGFGQRASRRTGVKRGYVVDMPAATYAVRDAIERAEKMANTSVSGVWVGCSGAVWPVGSRMLKMRSADGASIG
jgi:cell division protein FtsA